jgi:hypothetical protein
MYNILMIPYSVDEGVNALKQVAIDFPNSNLPDVLDSLLRSIALALGIPEEYIALIKNGSKENKDDHISTNPRYSKMLSMIQQSLSKGIVDFIYKHLKARYTNSDGVLTQVIDKDKIEVLFKSSTNINNKLEDERLMLKAENMSSMVNVIDTIASSPNIPAKVNGDKFLEYWKVQMEKDPHIRNIFDILSEEEMKRLYGPDMTPGTGDETGGAAEEQGEPQPQQQKETPKGEEEKQEVEVKEEPQPRVDTKQEEIIRNSFQ